MQQAYSFPAWFLVNWSRTALPCAFVLLALSPFLLRGLGLEAFLVFLQLPVYMIHQYEEHAEGRFKAFVTQQLGRGREVLSDAAIFWINIGLVWIVDLAALYLAVYVSLALGLIAVYLTLLNGIIHVVTTLVLRRYNPGLWTSIVLFLPCAGYALSVIGARPEINMQAHLAGLAAAILGHLAIVLHARRKIVVAGP